jgi:hypothetical protein
MFNPDVAHMLISRRDEYNTYFFLLRKRGMKYSRFR